MHSDTKLENPFFQKKVEGTPECKAKAASIKPPRKTASQLPIRQAHVVRASPPTVVEFVFKFIFRIYIKYKYPDCRYILFLNVYVNTSLR